MPDSRAAARVVTGLMAVYVSTVAEGVETEEQARILTTLGCDIVYARPAGPADALALVDPKGAWLGATA